jgi:transposase
LSTAISTPAPLRCPPAFTLGVDVGKDKLACALRDAVTRNLLWERDYPNTTQGISTLLGKLPPETALVVEPTGRYSCPVVQQANDNHTPVLLAPTRRAKAFLASIQHRAKCDRLDGRGLSLFALSVPLQPFVPRSVPVEKVHHLLSARKGIAQAVSRLTLQRSELAQAAPFLQSAIASLREQLTALDRAIEQAGKEETTLFATMTRLRGVPGIGKVTAASVAACLVSKRFASPDAFVAYCGLDIAVRQSGKRSGGLGLSHQGDAELRRLLFLCAQSSLRVKDSPFKGQYERERAKGLSATAASCAVARKLAKLCWSLHRHGTDYDPNRVHQQQDQQQERPHRRPTKATNVATNP